MGFLIYGAFSNSYHAKEIKALETEIGAVQKKFDAAVEEKEKLNKMWVFDKQKEKLPQIILDRKNLKP